MLADLDSLRRTLAPLLVVLLFVLAPFMLRAAPAEPAGPIARTDVEVPDVVGETSYDAVVELLQGYFKLGNITIQDTGGSTLALDKGRRDVVSAINPAVGTSVPETSSVTLTVMTEVTVDPGTWSGYSGDYVRQQLEGTRGLHVLIYVSGIAGYTQCESCSANPVSKILYFPTGPGNAPALLPSPYKVLAGSVIGLVVSGTAPATSTLTVSDVIGLGAVDGYMSLRKVGVPHDEIEVLSNVDADTLQLFHYLNKSQTLGRNDVVLDVFPNVGGTITINTGNGVPEVLLTAMEGITVPVGTLLDQQASTVLAYLGDLGLYPIYYTRNLEPCDAGDNCGSYNVIAIGHFPLGPTNPPVTEPPNSVPQLSVGDLVAIVVPVTDH